MDGSENFLYFIKNFILYDDFIFLNYFYVFSNEGEYLGWNKKIAKENVLLQYEFLNFIVFNVFFFYFISFYIF